MPCPVFHPTRVVQRTTHTGGRLPLIDEYEGVCTAGGGSYHPDSLTSFRCCNHGYSDGGCKRLQETAKFRSMRYSVLGRGAGTLDVICIEEVDHEPLRWHRFEYLVEESTLRGALPTECIHAQALAFCRAYLRHVI